MKKLLVCVAAAAALTAPLAAHAVVYQFNANINQANEVPVSGSPATGVATLFYDDNGTASTADDLFNFSLSVFNLTGPATVYHIHAPAAVGVNGPVVVNLGAAPFVSFISGGTLLVGGSNVAPPSVSFLSQLQGGLAYVNVHSAAFPGGEVRGQLNLVAAVVPEPSSLVLLAGGLCAIGLLYRRRKTI